MKEALPIVTWYKCPYCETSFERLQDAQNCQGMCHLASLIDDECYLGDDNWKPPLTLDKFPNWSRGDRAEFARRLDRFARKYYMDNTPVEGGKKI